RSYSRTVESSAKISGPFSRNCFFQSPTEFGCTSYAFATCASDLSSVRTSRTTWNLSFGEYVRRVALPMGTSPVRASVSAPRTGRSTPQCSGVQLFGVISADLFRNRLDGSPLRGVLALVLEHHPNRPLPHLGGVLLCLSHDPNLSKVGASGKPRAVQTPLGWVPVPTSYPRVGRGAREGYS